MESKELVRNRINKDSSAKKNILEALMYSPRNAFLILGQPLCGKIQTRADCHLYSIQNEVRLMGLSPNFNSRWMWAYHALPTVRKQWEARLHFQTTSMSIVPHTIFFVRPSSTFYTNEIYRLLDFKIHISFNTFSMEQKPADHKPQS